MVHCMYKSGISVEGELGFFSHENLAFKLGRFICL